MEHKHFFVKVAKVSDEYTVEVKAAVYNNIDLGNDRILPKACAADLSLNGNKRPMLWSHNADEPIGWWEFTDTPSALMALGHFTRGMTKAEDIYAWTKAMHAADLPVGASIGYQVEPGGATFDRTGVRILSKLSLVETSLCVFPMNPLATVTGVKDESGSMLEAVSNELQRLIAREKHKANVDRTVDTLFALARAERALARLRNL
jgi:HK97 family phage prohead protease